MHSRFITQVSNEFDTIFAHFFATIFTVHLRTECWPKNLNRITWTENSWQNYIVVSFYGLRCSRGKPYWLSLVHSFIFFHIDNNNNNNKEIVLVTFCTFWVSDHLKTTRQILRAFPMLIELFLEDDKVISPEEKKTKDKRLLWKPTMNLRQWLTFVYVQYPHSRLGLEFHGYQWDKNEMNDFN